MNCGDRLAIHNARAGSAQVPGVLIYSTGPSAATSRIDDDVLVELTGLTIEQIHAGIAWHNERARVFRERHGRND